MASRTEKRKFKTEEEENFEIFELQNPSWKTFKENLEINEMLILWSINRVEESHKFLIFMLLNMGVYDLCFENKTLNDVLNLELIQSQEIELIDAFVKRKLLLPSRYISKCIYYDKYKSFGCLLSFLTMKEIDNNFQGESLIDLAILGSKPMFVKLLIDKGADVLNFEMNFTRDEQKLECLSMIQKKREEIVFILLSPYLIDDLCNFVSTFFLICL